MQFRPYSPVTSLASWSNRLLLRGACWTRRQLFAVGQPWLDFGVLCSPPRPWWRHLPSQIHPPSTHPSSASRDMSPATQPCVDVAVCISSLSRLARDLPALEALGNRQPATAFIPRCLPATVHAGACSAARSQRCRKQHPNQLLLPVSCPVLHLATDELPFANTGWA